MCHWIAGRAKVSLICDGNIGTGLAATFSEPDMAGEVALATDAPLKHILKFGDSVKALFHSPNEFFRISIIETCSCRISPWPAACTHRDGSEILCNHARFAARRALTIRSSPSKSLLACQIGQPLAVLAGSCATCYSDTAAYFQSGQRQGLSPRQLTLSPILSYKACNTIARPHVVEIECVVVAGYG